MKFTITLIISCTSLWLSNFSLLPEKANTPLLQGVWMQEGYGRVVEITKKKIKVYDLCVVSCTPSLSLPLKYINYIGKVSNLTESSLTISGGINHMDFKRIASMPDICIAKGKKDKDDPIYNFESVWNTFNEQYCAFDKRKVDWMEIYKKYRPLINPGSSDAHLYQTIEAMLDELKDGHVGIEEPDNIRIKAAPSSPAKTKTNNELPKPTNRELYVAARKSILDQYAITYKEYNKGVLRYGMMDNDIAYLQINAMERWSDYGISDNLSNSDFWKAYLKKANKEIDYSKANVDGTKAMMDQVLAESSNAKAYILDIRFNGGGLDEVALAIMNHFAQEEMPVFTKKARNGNGYTRTITAKVKPSVKRFTGPVYVLTSVETASAAEIMSLAAREMPNVTLIGTATEGIFSDILEKQMPNGWEYGLSNEIYETMDGLDFESKGVPPDHEVPYRRWTRGFLEDINGDLKDGDNAIEKVIALSK